MLSSFFMMKESNMKRINSYGQITGEQVSLYDKDMQIQYAIKGLNIRGCIQLDQRYLYAISDSINVPITVSSNTSDEKVEETLEKYSPSGFYVYNTDQLF